MSLPEAAVTRPLFGFLLAAYLITAAGHLYLGDAWSMLRTAESIVTRGQLAIEPDPGFGGKRGPDGRFYAKYGAGVAAHMLVPAAVGHALSELVPPEKKLERALWMGLPASYVNAPFTAAIGAVFFAIALALGYPPRASVWAALALAFGTMLWPHAKHDAFEPQMTAALMVGAWYAIHSGAGTSFKAGLACGWAMLVKPVAVLVAAPLAVYVAARRGRRGFLGFSAGPALAIALTLAYDLVRFGNPLETGYSAEVQAFGIPLVMGVYGLVFSAGKGLLWYSPALVFAALGAPRFRARHPLEWNLVLWTTALHLVFYGMQQNWDGDWCWGPRYLLPCLPFLMLCALPVTDAPPSGWRFGLLGALGALAMFVQVLGVGINPSTYVKWVSSQKATLGDFLAQPQKTYIPLHPHHFNPDFSPLRGHLHLLRETLATPAGGQPRPMIIYSSVEERTDDGGHHLERVLELPLPAEHLGLDLWLPVTLALAGGRPLPTIAVWLAFMILALALVRQRRRVWRLVRLAEVED